MAKRPRPNQRFFELLDYKPFNIQAAIHNSRADRRVVCVGRQVGKSEAAAVEAVFELLANPGSVGWVIAPVYDQAEIIFNRTVEKLEKLAEKIPTIEVRVQRRKLRVVVRHYREPPPVPGKFIGMTPFAESEFRGKSGDDLTNLRGATLNFAILDEAAMMEEAVWSEAIEPMLSTTKGWALFISTPQGWNWFYRFFQKGWRGKDVPENYAEQFGSLGVTTPPPASEETLDPNWESFHAASWEVRFDVGLEWYENARKTQTDIIFRQEYGAEFISHSGSVFGRGIDMIVRLPYVDVGGRWVVEKAKPGAEYVIGADFGKNQDWSVFSVLDLSTGQVVAMLRTNDTSWRNQRKMLKRLALDYNDALVVADSWGIGEVLVEDLYYDGLRVMEAPFKTIQIKENYINHLSLLMQSSAVALPNNEIIFDELRDFQYHTTPTGRTTMRAHGRGHDDIVVSLALAYHLYDGGGMFAFDPGDVEDLANEMSLAESYSEWAAFEIESEFAEANRMFENH